MARLGGRRRLTDRGYYFVTQDREHARTALPKLDTPRTGPSRVGAGALRPTAKARHHRFSRYQPVEVLSQHVKFVSCIAY